MQRSSNLDQDRIIKSLRLQLRIERSIIALIAIFFVVWLARDSFHARAYVILANGKPVACVATYKQAQSVLNHVKGAVAGAKPEDVSFEEKVDIGRAPKDVKIQSESDATKAALGKLSLQVQKYVILIDSKPAVGVDSSEIAGQVIEEAKAKFGSLVKDLMEEPGIKEKYDVQKMPVDLDLYRPTVEQALDTLLTGGSGGPAEYTVESGDVAGRIAMRFGMTLSDLEGLNPGRDLQKLQIGDNLRVSSRTDDSRPRLTVVVRDREERTEAIPYTTEQVTSVRLKSGKQTELSPGRNGLRHVVVAVTYENGKKMGDEIVEETVLRNPVPRRVAVGA